jgi:hypothetical protein
MMRNWIARLFSADDSVSFGRIAAGVVLVFGIGWATYIVWRRLEIPSLEGVTTMVASLYGGSKIGETIQLFAKGKGNDKAHGESEIGEK